ncbi:MAG: GMC family oxidoreductase [Zetaproteobacteria bacterium]|nr:GMC family oxidoreductase [Zetaproteobacteria bacterium]
MGDFFDCVIVGSGVAGSLLARELAKAGKRVCMLEAGDRWERSDALERYHASWNRTITAPYKQGNWLLTPADDQYFAKQGHGEYLPSILKGAGGTTWHWTGITPRFLPTDFKLQQHYGVGDNWPIDYEALEPFYCQAEKALGVSGDSNHDHGSPRSKKYPMPAIPMTYGDKLLAEKLKAKGIRIESLPAARNSIDYDGRPACRGNNTCTPICPIGASYSADVDVDKAIAAGAVLKLKSVAYRLDTDPKSNKITKLHYKKPDGSSHTIEGGRFILACNSLENPRLLLMSKNNLNPNGIANSSDLVGRRLMDHAIFSFKFRMSEPLYIGRGPQSVSTIMEGRDGDFRSRYAAAKFFLGNDLNVHQEAAELMNNAANWVEPLKNLRDIAIHQGQIGAEIEQLPDKSNRITLDMNRLDPLGLPLPSVNYKLTRYSKQGLDHWKRYVKKLIRTLDASITGEWDSLSSHHPAGTTCMGSHRKSSVVNANCQSHDHENLYIVGNSVFPTMGTANPTLTIAALSLRLADHLITASK